VLHAEKKSIASAFLIAIILSGLFLVLTMHFSGAQTSGTNVTDTSVTGIIYSNTTWTQAGSPYTFTGPVAVNKGVTLTIQAGTIVNLDNNYLQVNGTLVAIGTSTHYIQFIGPSAFSGIQFTAVSNGWNEQTDSGSIIQYANVSSTTINLESPAKIDHNILSGNIVMDSVVEASCGVISNNIVTASYGAGIECSGNASVLDNTVVGAVWGGIDAFSGSPTIQGNLVTGNMGWGGAVPQGGIVVRNGYDSNEPITPLIQDNTVTNNNLGITVANTVSSHNVVPTISNNNIYGNQKYNFYLNQLSYNMSATNNWWGTTDTQAINQTIYDFKDNYNFGNVTFVPFLAAPNTEAPTFVNATAGVDGSISPSGIVSLSYGGSQAFTLTPNNGYHIANVSVNGTSVGAVSPYTVQNVDGATTISATFAPGSTPTPTATPTPTPASSPTASPTPSPTPSSTATPSSTPTPSPTSTPTIPEFPSLLVILTLFMAVSLFIAAQVTVRKNKIIKS